MAIANSYTSPSINNIPDKNPLAITINNLENSTWNNKTVPYSLTVEKPYSWFEESSLQDRPPQSKLVSVDCIIDGIQKVNLVSRNRLVDEYRRPEPLRLNGNLPKLPDENHTFRFSIDSVSYNLSPDSGTSYFGFWKSPGFPDKYNQTTYSNEISFIRDKTRPESEKDPFPTALAMSSGGAAVIVTVCGLLLFKKRKS